MTCSARLHQKFIKTFISLSFLLSATYSYAGWNNLDTGINDCLTGVAFSGLNGIVSGHKGLYYTSTGGNGASSWQRFNITTSTSDSLIYNHSKFNHCFQRSTSLAEVYACGEDTLSHKAIIIRLNLTAMNYSIIYVGELNSVLNKIAFRASNSSCYAVGNNGLMVNFTSSTVGVVTTSLTQNLNSISFSGDAVLIGTNGSFIRGTANQNVFSLTILPTPTDNYKDVYYSNSNNAYAVGNTFFKYSGLILSSVNEYDFGSLNANCIRLANSSYYIGTDHGIFKTSDGAFLEWQPTSLNYHINSIANDPLSSNTMYACGINGLLLTTNDQGGTPKPYVKVTSTGSCIGTSVTLSAITGSATSCSWYIDGVYGYSGCNSTNNHLFTVAGAHTIRLQAYSGGLGDTSSMIVHIVTPPTINKPVIIDQDIICHVEPIAITVDMSEQSVFYILRKFGSTQTFGSSGPGNGGQITFSSQPISEAGSYFLRAQSTLSSCFRNFTDTIEITVEKTKADFHVGLFNAEVGEPVNLYSKCQDAQQFQWTFLPDGSSSTLADPQAVFNIAGQTSVKLIATSTNGCSDSIQKNGPMVYQPTPTDSCWTIMNNGTDDTWQGGYEGDIAKMSPSTTGFLTCGYFRDTHFASTHGDSVELPSFAGAYVAKYNFDGTLKWMVRTRKISLSTDQDNVYSVVEDKLGNVYLSGYSTNYFFDNTGDSIYVSVNGTGRYIIKVDANGKFLWKLTSVALFLNLSVDQSDNLYISGWISDNPGTIDLTLETLNTPPQLVFTEQLPWTYGLIKIAPDGTVIWSNGMTFNSPNAAGIIKMNFDAQNNLYITGKYEVQLDLFSVGNPVPESFYWNNPGNYGAKLFLAKFDSLGILQWKIRSFTSSTSDWTDWTQPHDMATDSIGNCYVSGINNCDRPSYQQHFENTDGTFTSLSEGKYFAAKISPQGICQWIRGQKYAFYGNGYSITERGNEISVLGQSTENVATYFIDTSLYTSSQTGQMINLAIDRSDYFIAVYDTMGKLLRMHVNGSNNNDVINQYGIQLMNGPDHTYYISRNIKFYQAGSDYMNFGTVINNPNGIDGTITRCVPSCGLTYYPVEATVVTDTGCVTYSMNGHQYNLQGTYTQTLQDLNGNDSLVVLNLALDFPSEYTLTESSCSIYEFNNFSYDSSGTYTVNFQASSGCIHTVHIELTIDHLASDTSVSTCQPYEWNGTTYSLSGDYTNTYVTNEGCDSIALLHLTVEPLMFEIYQTTCTDFELNGVTYDTSGIYQQILTTAEGCDSIVALFLTVNTSDSSELNITALDTYTLNNIEYTQSGIYEQQILTTEGCDSIINLNLVIHYAGLIETENQELSIYPNPFSNELNIDLPEEVSSHITILDLNGRILMSFSSSKREIKIDVDDFAEGVYFLKMFTTAEERTIKLLKK